MQIYDKRGLKLNSNETRAPKMLTIRECAATGIMPEHALRTLVKAGFVSHIKVGNRAYIDYDKLVAQLAGI